MCSSFKQLVPIVFVITAHLILAACVNSAQASPQRVLLANSTELTLSAEFSTPTPAESPNPTSASTKTPVVTTTPEPTGQPTPVSTSTTEAVPTTVGTEAPAVPSNPSNESLIGPDGKLKPAIPLKFLGLEEQTPIWGHMPLKSDGTVIMGVVTPFESIRGAIQGGFSVIVEKPAFEENGHTYLGIVGQNPNGRIAHMKLRIDEFTGKNKQGYYLTGYADAIGGVWTPNPALSPALKKTDSFRAVELLQIKDNFVFGDQIVINIADMRNAQNSPNLTEEQLAQVAQSNAEFGEQNNKLISGELPLSDGMVIGSVLNVIDPSPLPTPPPTETPAAVNEPSTQPGETDYSKMSQEQLKEIVDKAQRLWPARHGGEPGLELPLRVRP